MTLKVSGSSIDTNLRYFKSQCIWKANRKHGNAIGLTASPFVAATNKIKPKLDRENSQWISECRLDPGYRELTYPSEKSAI
jgi:hypothetical protein